MPVSGRVGLAVLGMIGLAAATPALAARTVVMTDSTRAAALAELQAGDTLKLEGTFAKALKFTNRDFGGVQVDAHDALLTNGIYVQNVQNLAISGGIFGTAAANTRDWYAVRLLGVTNVSLTGATLVGTGTNSRGGLQVSGANMLTLRDNEVSGFRMGMHVGGATDSLITNNHFTNLTEDGLRVISSNRVIVSENSCTGFSPHDTAHPDCIQMWTGSGAAAAGQVQSDIYVLNNTAIGAMQAFVSFDPGAYSGERMTFAGNYAAVTYPHGVSCYGCRNSLIQDNVLVTLPGAQWEVAIRTPDSINVVRDNNPRHDLRTLADPDNYVLPDRIWSSLVPSIVGAAGSTLASQVWNSQLQVANFASPDDISAFGTGSVPEPATWLLLGLGFAIVGRALRNNRGGLRHALA